jgi:hypothetical protein
MHIIRLRKPWSCQVQATMRDGILTSVEALPQTVDVPGDWSPVADASFRGTVQYTRTFNRPTGIEVRTRVVLCLELVDGRADVTLNGEPVGVACWPDLPRRFEIKEQLAIRNELVVAVSLLDEPEPTPRPPSRGAGDPGGLIGDVRLEIS